MFKALLWDVDGTLAETERDGHRVAFNMAFKEFGLPWRWGEAEYGALLRVTGGRERLLADWERTPRAGVPAAGPERERLAAALHRRKNAIYGHIVASGRLPARPGVVALIEAAQRAGLQQAIVTTTSRSNVEALLPSLLGPAWREVFATVVAAEDAPLKKPLPQAYEVALRRLGLRAHEALAIEDSDNGVRAAGGAGVPVLMVRSRYFAADAGEGALARLGSLEGVGLEALQPMMDAVATSSSKSRIDTAPETA